MRIRYQKRGAKTIEVSDNSIKESTILLANKIGGYLMLGAIPYSRYCGCFFSEKGKTFKVIEDITTAKQITKLKYNLWNAERTRYENWENFFMPYGHNSLIFSSDGIQEYDLLLDVRESYDTREWGRSYTIQEKTKDYVVIKYCKFTDLKEDKTQGEKEYEAFITIRGQNLPEKLTDTWDERQYEYDKKRGSSPTKRWVYNSIKLKGEKFVISFSLDLKKSIKDSKEIYKRIGKLERHQQEHIEKITKHANLPSIEIEQAYKAAIVSLDMLETKNELGNGILAGLPWFFQYWTRDESISLKALMQIGSLREAKEIIFKHINTIPPDGRINNRLPISNLPSADATGWVFKRIDDYIQILKKRNELHKYINEKEMNMIKDRLHHTIYMLRKYHCKPNMILNGKKETWMDTVNKGDDREGFRIEIQAQLLELYKIIHDLTDDAKYLHYEMELKKDIKKFFWDGKKLFDGYADSTIRPNIFLTAYIHYDLLQKDEWKICFNNSMPKLWLEWGGLSTIDKENSLYQEWHTGEDNKSYHRGDSWYYLNNMAAIILHKTDAELFKDYVQKILESSTKEILYYGAIGHHAEISSAGERQSLGCLCQAWSAAMYIEMVNEIFKVEQVPKKRFVFF